MATRRPMMRKQATSKSTTNAQKLTAEQKRQVKMLLTKQLELKSYDIGGGPTVSSVANITHLTPLPQGSGQSQRVGNEIVCSHAELSYELAIGDTINWIRVIMFQWHEDNGISVPTTPDILFTPASTNFGMNLYHFDERHRFKILFDKVHRLEANSLGSTIFVKDLRIKIPHKTLTYNGSATNGQNQLYLWVVSDSALAAHPAIIWQARLLYRDA